jgi:hypothetical protein
MGNFQQLPQIYAKVFEALDASVALQTALPSSEASIQRALVELRRETRDPEAIEQLEAISLNLQAMRAAAMRGSADERLRTRDRLSALAAEWMQRLPMH